MRPDFFKARVLYRPECMQILVNRLWRMFHSVGATCAPGGRLVFSVPEVAPLVEDCARHRDYLAPLTTLKRMPYAKRVEWPLVELQVQLHFYGMSTSAFKLWHVS